MRRGMPMFDGCQKAHEIAADALQDRNRNALSAFCDLVENGRALIASAQNGTHPGGLKEAARAYLQAAGLQDDLQAAAPTPLAAQKKLDNLEGFLTSLERFEQREGRDLGAFLHRISLDTKDDDDGHDHSDQVTLVTLHGAKGLEFPVVFLVGMEEELLPHKRTLYPDGPDVLDANPDLGEERRLMYVGITRAKETLSLSYAKRRKRFGEIIANQPSRFLAELPADDLHWSGRDAEQDAAHKQELASSHLARLASLLAD